MSLTISPHLEYNIRHGCSMLMSLLLIGWGKDVKMDVGWDIYKLENNGRRSDDLGMRLLTALVHEDRKRKTVNTLLL